MGGAAWVPSRNACKIRELQEPLVPPPPPPPPIHSFASFLERERGGPQLKLEMGKVHHPSPPTTTTTPTSQEHGRPQKKRCNFSHEIAFIFMEERSRKRSPSSVDCAVVGRGAGPLRDMSYGFKEFKVAAEESQKGDPKVLAYRGTPKHLLE